MELIPRYTARATAALIRLVGAGQASSLPGKLVNTVFPGFLRSHAQRLTEGMAMVTGTNGKTTTANMAAGILSAAGRHIVHNSEGANLLSGIATAFTRCPDARFALLEVDEAIAPVVARDLRSPDVVCFTNLFRDQLDRYGEVDRLATGWLRMLDGLPGVRLVANADDPLVADVALRSGREVLFYGVEGAGRRAGHEVSDVPTCPRCAAMLVYEERWLSQLGDYRCPGCGFARPPRDLWADLAPAGSTAGACAGAAPGAPNGMATGAPDETRTGAPAGNGDTVAGAPLHGLIEEPLRLRVPGLHNTYNALGALGLALTLGVEPRRALDSLGVYQPVFGRWSCVRSGTTTIRVNLTKNPASMNQSLRTIDELSGPKAIVFVLNDRIADGRDISWIWDIDMEDLLPPHARIVTTGTRRGEMALRLKYAGVPVERICSTPTLAGALDLLLDEGEERIYLLPTYTALREVRSLLAAWEEVEA